MGVLTQEYSVGLEIDRYGSFRELILVGEELEKVRLTVTKRQVFNKSKPWNLLFGVQKSCKYDFRFHVEHENISRISSILRRVQPDI